MAWNTMAELTRIKLLNKRVRYAYTHTHARGPDARVRDGCRDAGAV